MINWIEKGHGLVEALRAAGLDVIQHGDGSFHCIDLAREDEAQIFINAYDYRDDLLIELKAAEAAKRTEFVTSAPGKDAEYRAKEAEAAAYLNDGTVGTYLQMEIDINGIDPAALAAEWQAKSSAWHEIAAYMSSVETAARLSISGGNYALDRDLIDAAIADIQAVGQ